MGALNPGDVVKDHKNVLLPLIGAVVLILGLGWYFSKGGDFTSLSNPFSGDDGSKDDIKRDYKSYPDTVIKDDVNYSATIKTNKGDIVVDLYEKAAPKTVNNFVYLSKEDFYDGLLIHRVSKGFVIQGGDPKGDGTGGPGYKFEDEINPKSLGLDKILVKNATFLSGLYNPYDTSTSGYAPNSLREHADDTLEYFYKDAIGYDYKYDIASYKFAPGVIAMANSGPNTNGSQFFITVSNSDTSSLNGRHTVFGRVTSGMDVVDEISNVLVDDKEKPVDDIEIEDIKIHEN